MTPSHPRPVALVTGAARRVGAVIARSLHAAGYDLALHYRHSLDAARALADELEQQRPRQLPCCCRPSWPISRCCPSWSSACSAHYGRLDALVNNASAFYPTPVGQATAAHWNELFASNAQAPFFLSQAAVPALREAKGSIVNLLDIYAERPLANHPLYCMAKAALAAMTRSLALDLGPAIRVNGVAPGAVLWPNEGKGYDDQQAMLARTPLQRAGTPEDVASAVLWLLRDAPFVTGQIIRVDGGRTLSV